MFHNPFDFDHDGKLDFWETAAEFNTFMDVTEDSQDADENTWLSTVYNGIEDESEIQSALKDNGLELSDLEDMDENERRNALEDAGLDPDDFSF